MQQTEDPSFEVPGAACADDDARLDPSGGTAGFLAWKPQDRTINRDQGFVLCVPVTILDLTDTTQVDLIAIRSISGPNPVLPSCVLFFFSGVGFSRKRQPLFPFPFSLPSFLSLSSVFDLQSLPRARNASIQQPSLIIMQPRLLIESECHATAILPCQCHYHHHAPSISRSLFHSLPGTWTVRTNFCCR